MSTESDVRADRRTAIVVGVLFLVALVLYLVGSLIYGPATGSEDFLERAYPDRRTVTSGVLIEFVAVLAIPMIGFFMFPVMKRFSEALALAYVGFRSLEAIFLVAIEARVLALIDLSEEHETAEAADDAALQVIGDSLAAESDRLFVLYVLVFAVGALIFYVVLNRASLVPRWLSIWGFASAAWMLLGTVLVMFDTFSGTSESTVEAIFVLPLPLNELTLAFWLIFKGFNDRSPDTADWVEGGEGRTGSGRFELTDTRAEGGGR